jgi:hypothetical protein
MNYPELTLGVVHVPSRNKNPFVKTGDVFVSVDIVSKSWNQLESYIIDTYRVLEQYQHI